MRILPILLSTVLLFSSNAAMADPRHHGGHDRGHDRGRDWGYRHDHRGPVFYGSHYYGPRLFPGGMIVIRDTRPVYIERDYIDARPGVRYMPPEPAQVEYRDEDEADGRYCREYTSKVAVGGRLQESYGQACLQPDGSWEIIS
ncbi:hypothetical protein GC177_05055 [bacterium]|nr:hypothetical protein [bacterium]